MAILGVGWAPGPLDALAFLVRVILTVGADIRGTVMMAHVHLVVISETWLLHRASFATVMSALGGRDTLALALGLPDSELLGDKAVFDHLIDVLFLGKGAFIIEVHAAHLLTYVRLVHALGVMADETVTHEALADEAAIDAVGVRSSGPLLMATWLDLVFAQENTFTVDLLEGDVCG